MATEPPLEKIGDKLNEKGTITVKQIRCLKKKILGVTANFFCSKKKKKANSNTLCINWYKIQNIQGFINKQT